VTDFFKIRAMSVVSPLSVYEGLQDQAKRNCLSAVISGDED
jgi:hypothetical protein